MDANFQQAVWENVVANLLAHPLLLLFGSISALVLVYLKATLAKTRRARPSPEGTAERETGTISIDPPVGSSIAQKLEDLARRRKVAADTALDARRRGIDDAAARRECAGIDAAIQNLQFLAPGDKLRDTLELVARIGAGRMSQVWKIYDAEHDRFFAAKILRPHLAADAVVIDRFFRGAETADELRSAHVPAVHGQHRREAVHGTLKMPFYLMDYVEGPTLEQYVIDAHKSIETIGSRLHFTAAVVREVLRLGECLAYAHSKNIVHRDVRPDNIIVRPGGQLTLVDFDSVATRAECHHLHRDIGVAGFAPPELLEGRPHDQTVDVFGLARVLAFVYYGKQLPSIYEMSASGLIDSLNCPYSVKAVLRKATASKTGARFSDIGSFLTAIEAAMPRDRDGRTVPELIRSIFELLRQVTHERLDRVKVYTVLRHAALGTTVAMMLARPTMAALAGFIRTLTATADANAALAQPLADTGQTVAPIAATIATPWQTMYLSDDRVAVAIFHGIIGALVWGSFISAGFLLQQTVWRRDDRWDPVRAMLLCGVAGFCGGMLCALPSVGVTNPIALSTLGWQNKTVSVLATRMIFAFPLTGLLTGMGTGLFLERRVNDLLRAGADGVVPIPVKLRMSNSLRDGFWFVTRMPKLHLYLMFPLIFSWIALLLLRPLNTGWQGLMMQSVGEGLIHYAGAVGLVSGFFMGVDGTVSRHIDEPR